MHQFNGNEINANGKFGRLATEAGYPLSELQVLKSRAGFYIGTIDPVTGPISRESSEYFTSINAASAALESGNWTQLSY